MSEPPRQRSRRIGSLIVIAVVVAVGAAAFAYTAGWLSPNRLTPQRLVDAFSPPSGPALGHRRNHAKGICFTGMFESNGAGSELSRAFAFSKGSYPVVGRFNLGTPDADAADATVRVRGLGVQISAPDGQEWRMALINPPFFAVSNPDGFFALLQASASKDPNAMPELIKVHPEIADFDAWAKSAPWTGSYAEEQYNSLDAFIFTDASGASHPMRWSLLPAAQPVPVPVEELAKRGPNFLEEEIVQRIKSGPARWTMVVTVRQSRRSDGGSQQGLAGRSPQGRGRNAGRADRSRLKRTAPAATSTSTRPYCRVGSPYPTIRSRPPARPPTASRSTAARPRRRTTREPLRGPANDGPALHARSSAPCTG